MKELTIVEERRQAERLRTLREIQIKLDWLIAATPSGKARNYLTDANILLNAVAAEPEFEGGV